MSDLKPLRDGHDHINVYSKGATELGRALTHFADLGFLHPTYGYFKTVESWWFWHRISLLHHEWTEAEQADIAKLPKLRGYEAKKLGNALLKKVSEAEWVGFPEEEFRESIHFANRLKLQTHSRVAKDLGESHLPLAHYYVFGEGEKAIARTGSHQWVLEGLEAYREELWTAYAQAYIYRLSYRKDGVEESTAWVDTTDGLQGNRKFYQALFNKLLTSANAPFSDKAKDAILGGLQKTGMFDSEEKANDFIISHFIKEDVGVCFKDFVSLSVCQHNGIRVSYKG